MNAVTEATPAYLARLNDAQRAAATHGIGAGVVSDPLLIIAGAGTGKTATLAHRVAHLLAHGADPERLLLLTFSRRAADEMTRRVQRIASQVSPRHATPRWPARASRGLEPSTASVRVCCASTPGGSASIRRLPFTTGKTRPI